MLILPPLPKLDFEINPLLLSIRKEGSIVRLPPLPKPLPVVSACAVIVLCSK